MKTINPLTNPGLSSIPITIGTKEPRSKLILPHHAFNGLIRLPAVFGILLLVIFHFYLSIYREVDKLADRHTFVNLYRLLYRNLQCPVAAKTNIPFTGSRMDVNSQAACAGLTFEEGNMRMGFRIFKRNTEIEYMRI